MKWGTPVWWGWFLLFSRSRGHKTKETYPTRPGSPTQCKQGLSIEGGVSKIKKARKKNFLLCLSGDFSLALCSFLGFHHLN